MTEKYLQASFNVNRIWLNPVREKKVSVFEGWKVIKLQTFWARNESSDTKEKYKVWEECRKATVLDLNIQ